jgi:hypothetical protein
VLRESGIEPEAEAAEATIEGVVAEIVRRSGVT